MNDTTKDSRIIGALCLLIRLLLPLAVLCSVAASQAATTPPDDAQTVAAAHPDTEALDAVLDNTIFNLKKHDFARLDVRAGADAMAGVAYTDYGNSCIYCHVPGQEGMEGEIIDLKKGQIPQWNRYTPNIKKYKPYSSNTMKTQGKASPGNISLLCLSCHDGTMALDRVVEKPVTWNNEQEALLHMRMDTSNDLQSCGKCHDGKTAHEIASKVIGTDLTDVHPIGIRYAGLEQDIKGYFLPENKSGFKNGVKLYDEKIECATCHDIHNTESYMLLRVKANQLCITCHAK